MIKNSHQNFFLLKRTNVLSRNLMRIYSHRTKVSRIDFIFEGLMLDGLAMLTQNFEAFEALQLKNAKIWFSFLNKIKFT